VYTDEVRGTVGEIENFIISNKLDTDEGLDEYKKNANSNRLVAKEK